MKKFYFTFGSDEKFPYQNGYIVIIAEKYGDAIEKFKNTFPSRTPGDPTLNYSFDYDEVEWDVSKNDKNQAPFKTLYANPSIKREFDLFQQLLDIFKLSYKLDFEKITIYDSEGNPYKDSDGDILYFNNTVDAMNSLDWLYNDIEENIEEIPSFIDEYNQDYE